METEEKYLEKPWLRTLDAGCAPVTNEPYPELTYTEFHLDERVKKYPNTLALVQLDYEMTYKELKEHADRLATALSAMGIKKGDVVATLLPTCIQFVIADLAIPETGAIHCPMSIVDSVESFADKVDRTNCKTMICVHTNVKDGDILETVKEVKKRTDLKTIILTKVEDYSSKVPVHEKEEGIVWFTDLIKKYPPNPPKVDIAVKKDLSHLFFTGGTTGRPKGVMLSHHGIVS